MRTPAKVIGIGTMLELMIKFLKKCKGASNGSEDANDTIEYTKPIR